MNPEVSEKSPAMPGDIMALDTVVAAFVFLVEGVEEGFRDPKYGVRFYFRWLAHPDAAMVTTRDWIWESTLRERSWLKIA